jgi:hypothetical protein
MSMITASNESDDFNEEFNAVARQGNYLNSVVALQANTMLTNPMMFRWKLSELAIAIRSLLR